MKYRPEQEIRIDNRNLYVIDCANYNGKDYIYAQEIDTEEDDLTMNYFVYEVGEHDSLVEDQTILNPLLGIFSEKIREKI